MTKKAEAEARRKIDLLIKLWAESGSRYIGFPVKSYRMRPNDTDNVFHIKNAMEWNKHPISSDMLRWANEIWKQLIDKIKETDYDRYKSSNFPSW